MLSSIQRVALELRKASLMHHHVRKPFLTLVVTVAPAIREQAKQLVTASATGQTSLLQLEPTKVEVVVEVVVVVAKIQPRSLDEDDLGKPPIVTASAVEKTN